MGKKRIIHYGYYSYVHQRHWAPPFFWWLFPQVPRIHDGGFLILLSWLLTQHLGRAKSDPRDPWDEKLTRIDIFDGEETIRNLRFFHIFWD